MRFSDRLAGPLLTTEEWLDQHQACLPDGDTHQVLTYGGPWLLVICPCTSRHLMHTDEVAALDHPGLPDVDRGTATIH